MNEPAIPAASLILIREPASGPLKYLMIERARSLRAFGGALVFPGGRIDPADDDLARAFDDPQAAAKIAAIRETIEETAVPAGLDPLPVAGLVLELQAELHAGGDFTRLLRRHGLKLDLAALTYFTRWRPDHRPGRRFDTHFFVARSSGIAREPVFHDVESAGAHWLTSGEAQRWAVEGRGKLVFPTRCNLQRLALHGSFDAVLEDIGAHPPRLVSPWIEVRDDVPWINIPDTLGYPVTTERWHSRLADSAEDGEGS